MLGEIIHTFYMHIDEDLTETKHLHHMTMRLGLLSLRHRMIDSWQLYGPPGVNHSVTEISL